MCYSSILEVEAGRSQGRRQPVKKPEYEPTLRHIMRLCFNKTNEKTRVALGQRIEESYRVESVLDSSNKSGYLHPMIQHLVIQHQMGTNTSYGLGVVMICPL